MGYWITCKCGKKIRHNKSGLCVICVSTGRTGSTPTVERELEQRRENAELTGLRGRYQHALKAIETKDKQLATLGFLRSNTTTHVIEPSLPGGTSEGTIFAAASDWHSEEEVTLQQTNGRNRFNLDIAKESSDIFFKALLRLTRLLQQDIRISEMVLALLGDFITNGDLHDGEQRESTLLGPMHALVFAQENIVSGLEFLLNNSKLRLTVPCHSGNHARVTHKVRPGHENAHSLEFLLYKNLVDHFRGEERIKFLVPESQDSIVTCYGHKTRFQHGHALKYNGGVGGLTIPANKAVDVWNTTERVDLDVFGHFHQTHDEGHWLSNGSMVGYNAFAKWIKARFEPPKQNMWLLDKKRGRTCTWPILFPQR